MTASVDKSSQVVEVGALVELTANVLSHGIAFISKEYPPLVMKFELDENGDVSGYDIQPVEKESALVKTFSFVKVGAVIEHKSAILGVQKTPKLILPGA